MTRIRITLGDMVVTATLDDTNTARLIADALPVTSTTQRWGDEVYFQIPVQADEEDARADVPSGTVAYWLAGNALCLFFGQKPYSPVNVVGRIEGDPRILANVKDGETVRVESA